MTTSTSTRTVDRALNLMASVTESESDHGKSLSELARDNDLSPSTASRLLSTLVRHDLVRRDAGGNYHPGSRLLQLGAAALRGGSLYDRAGTHLKEIALSTGETANLGIAADEDRALYLRQAPGPRLVQGAPWTGRTIPMDRTAMGAALRGEVGPEGFVSRRAAVEPDVTAIAAPVVDGSARVVGALSVIAPSFRTGSEDIRKIGRTLASHADALSAELGAAPAVRAA